MQLREKLEMSNSGDVCARMSLEFVRDRLQVLTFH